MRIADSPRRLLIAWVLLAPTVLAGVASGQPPTDSPVLDGLFTDWPEGVRTRADEHYLYLRLDMPETISLQAAASTFELLFELDGVDPADAGGGGAVADAIERGWDMLIRFSPPAPAGTNARRPGGVQVFALGTGGRRLSVSAADIGLAFAPTFASSSFELRLSRHLDGVGGLPARSFAGDSAAWKSVTLDEAGHVKSQGEVVTCRLPERGAASPLADVDVPPPTPLAEGAVRIVSWNVLKASPAQDPERFARVLTVLAPDIVIVQEWDKTTTADLQAWFNKQVPGERSWNAMMSDGPGVGVVSRFAVERLGPQRLQRPDGSAPDGNRPETVVRFAGALVRTTAGEIAIGSLHLKCCGGKDSREDQARMAEARAINSAFSAAAAERKVSVRLIAGDFNLVGSEPPLTTVCAGADSDGTSLSVAPAQVLGDRSYFTWCDADSPFTPGRLDYAVYSDATAEVVRAFVLDTARLSDEALRRAGLRREDSRASDHMPLVVDLRIKQ